MKRLGNLVVPDELGELHRLLIVHLRDAGALGMTRKEMRAIGVEDPRIAVLELRRAGYTIEARRSKIQPTDTFRWVLRREPRMPSPEQVTPAEIESAPAADDAPTTTPLELPLAEDES